MWREFAALLLLLLQACLAIHADEAGSIDYALNLLGAPQHQNTLFARPFPDSKASLLYTLSDRAALAAVNPKDGLLVWRQLLNGTSSSERGSISIGDGQEIVYSGLGDTVAAWSSLDGRLVWQKSFPNCRIKHVKAVETAAEKDPVEKDVVVILEGEQHAVYRLNSRSGATVWKHHDASSDELYALATTGSKVFIVQLRSAMLKGHKLRVVALDASTGKATDSFSPNSEDVTSKDDVLGVGITGKVPLLVWTDSSKQSIKVNILGSKPVTTFDVKSKATVEHISVHGPTSLAAPARFLVHVQTDSSHWAQVFDVDGAGMKVTKMPEDLPETPGSGSYAASAVGTVLYFTHTTLLETELYDSQSSKPLSKWTSKQTLTPVSVDSDSSVRLEHTASDVVKKADGTFAVRTAVYLQTGHWSLVQNGQRSWTRPEMLAGLVKAEWADTQEPDALTDELEAETQASVPSAFVHRITRHVSAVLGAFDQIGALGQALNDWLLAFTGTETNAQSKDQVFGFDKRIIAATRDGDIVVIDPTSPEKVVAQWRDVDFAKLGASQWNASTVGSLNGKLIQHMRLTTSGETDSAEALSTTRVTYTASESGLEGHLQGQKIWHFAPFKGQKILTVNNAIADEPIASIGKVLGDRRVLYKYLNPNLILVLSGSQESGQLTASLLDAVSGSVLSSASYTDVDLSRPITSAVTENWFAYSFASAPRDEARSRGFSLVMGELFESAIPNDRGPFAEKTNYSALAPAHGTQGSVKPYMYTHNYVIPEEISRMAVTQTTQGIASRQLLVYLAGSGSLVGIPHYVLDPRRPIDRDPTRQEQEEGLMRYAPFVDFDPQWHLTHKNTVLGIEEILTTPSAMESTSLVFAYGSLDVFGTRVTPSFSFDILGSSFNKVQLLLTVIGLTAGTFAVMPFVQRKQTNALWQT